MSLQPHIDTPQELQSWGAIVIVYEGENVTQRSVGQLWVALPIEMTNYIERPRIINVSPQRLDVCPIRSRVVFLPFRYHVKFAEKIF